MSTAERRSTKRRTRRAFGEISKLPSGRYRARYWGPGTYVGQRFSAPKTFLAKVDAEAWLADVDRDIAAGTWEPPTADDRSPETPKTLEPYAQAWLEGRAIRDTTRALYRRLLTNCIIPAFGSTGLRNITPAKVRAWYFGMKATPTQQANAYALLKSILHDAVEDELIRVNPCKVKGGAVKTRASEPEAITDAELAKYLEAVPEKYRMALLLAGWCALRSGEVRGLRRRDLDLTAGVVRVEQQAVRLGGKHVITKPKTAAGVRVVAIPVHVIPALREWLATQPVRGADGLLFTAGDGRSPLSQQTLRDAHVVGREAIGRPGLTIHGLRHTSLTLAAQAGATVAELQARAGHTTATQALRYQHASQERDRELAARMSARSVARPVTQPAADAGEGAGQAAGGR